MKSMKLAEILTLTKGKKPITLSASVQEGYLPYVDIEAFETGEIKQYTDGERCTPCDDGDILIVCDGSRSGLVGKAIKGYVGSTLAKIEVSDIMDNDYLYDYLKSLYPLLNTNTKGTGTPHLNQQLLKEQKIIIPDIVAQKQIVGKIEEMLSQLDGGVETLQKLKLQLQTYRQALLENAFTGEYERASLKNISQVISGYAFKSDNYNPNGEYVVVKIGNVKPFRFDFSRDCTKTNEADSSILDKYLLHEGDCLITLTGSRGKRDYGYVAMITTQTNFLLNQRVAALRFNKKVALPTFYQYYLSTTRFRENFFSYETGNVGQGNVGIKALTEPEVIVPRISEQKHIIEILEERLSNCNHLEQIVNLALQQAEAMRQSILKKAFEGGL